MSNSTAILRTASGIEAVLTLIRSDRMIILDATAVPSTATHEYDAVYDLALKRYLEATARNGIRYAGEPPLSGAHAMLAEIRVEPPKPVQTIGREVQSVGGSGSEWTTRWTWDLSGIESVDGELLVQTAVDQIKLPLY